MERSLFQGLIAICIVATFGVASAQPCDRALPVVSGQRLACAGVLVPTDQANKAIACLRFDLPACLERRRAADKVCDVDKSSLGALLKMERERVRSLLTVQPEPVVSGWFGEAVAFGLGVGVAALAVYAWSEVRD